MAYRKDRVVPDLDNYVAVAELAHSVGLEPDTVTVWFRRRLRRVYKHGSRNHVTLADADLYLKAWGLERVARRPRGWKSMKAAVSCGVGRITLWKAVKAGRVRGVMVGKVAYLHPDDLKQFALEYTDLKPLPGWVLVPALRDELGRSKEALNQWIRREKVEVKHFLHPTKNRPTPYIRDTDAERYRKIVAEVGDRHIPLASKTQQKTREAVLQAVVSSQDGSTPEAIAAATSISYGTCIRVAPLLAEEGLLERFGKGTAYYPYTYKVAPASEGGVSQSEKRARRDRDRLRAFAFDLLEAWAGGTASAQTVETLAILHGLVVEQTMTHPCGDGCTCWEFGHFPHPCLRFTSLVTGVHTDPTPETA